MPNFAKFSHGEHQTSSQPTVCVGIDLGQQKDPSAIAIAECKPEFTLSGDRLPTSVDIVHLERLPIGTPYPKVRERIETLASAMYFVDPDLVVDANGPGRPVIQELRARNIRRVIAVTATGGSAETKVKGGLHRAEDWNVSKGVLLKSLSTLVFAGRLRVAAQLDEAKQFHRELQSLEHRVSQAGRESFEVNATDHHADLVSAVSLAVWRLTKPKPIARQFNIRLHNL